MPTFNYLGKGSVFMGQKGSGKYLPIGNAPQLVFNAEEEKNELPDYENPGGGIVASVSRISRVSATVTFNDLRPENLEFLLRGTKTVVTGSAVTGESHTASLDGYVRLNGIIDPAQPVTVKDSVGTTTFAEGSDYVIMRGGLHIPSTSAIPDNSTILVDYTSLSGNKVEALTAGGKEFTMYFDGLNEGKNNTPVIVTVHRVKPAPFSNLPFIGNDFAAVDVQIDVLKDETITGSNLSQYFKVEAAI